MSHWIANLLLATCCLAEMRAPEARASRSADVAWGLAPDDERGFGTGRKLRDLERLLRSTEADDQAVLAALSGLPREVDALAAQAAEPARVHGYTVLLARGEPPTLERIGIAFRESLASAQARLERGASSAVLARMLVDARFRARARAAAGLALEVRELAAALALLGAQLDGYASLTDGEAELIARRADLAAARLRAIRLDLTALRADAATERVDVESTRDRESLQAALALADDAQRTAELQRVLAQLQEREDQAAAMLFTTLLRPKVQSLVRARDLAIDKAAAAVPAVRALMPDTPEGRKAPPDVRELSKARRYAYAARTGVEALAIDPLNAALNHLVAESLDFQWGIRDSRSWFDRYLALRGIRAHDHRTYKDKQLTDDERRALGALQTPVEVPR